MAGVLPVLAAFLLLACCGPSRAGTGPLPPDAGGRWETFPLEFRGLEPTRLAVGAPIPAGLKMGLPSPSGGFLMHPEGKRIRVDLDGDGSLDAEAEDGKPVFFFRVRTRGGRDFRYAVRFFRGPKRAWFYETATSMSGKVAGVEFSLIDADCNGKFDDVGKDAVLAGRAKWAVPLGNVISLRGRLFHIRADPDGTSVALREYTGATGTLDMRKNFKAPGTLLFAVVRCNEVYFDLAEPGGREVPVGAYALVRARLEREKKSCTVVRGTWKAFEVARGKEAAPAWGPPLRIVFRPRLQGGTLHIPALVQYLGRGQEEYVDFEDELSKPKIVVTSRSGAVVCKGRFEEG